MLAGFITMSNCNTKYLSQYSIPFFEDFHGHLIGEPQIFVREPQSFHWRPPDVQIGDNVHN